MPGSVWIPIDYSIIQGVQKMVEFLDGGDSGDDLKQLLLSEYIIRSFVNEILTKKTDQTERASSARVPAVALATRLAAALALRQACTGSLFQRPAASNQSYTVTKGRIGEGNCSSVGWGS